MPDRKNVPLLKEGSLEIPEYIPSEKERDVVSAIFSKFRTTANDRDRNFEYFDGSNLIEYIEDSVRRFTSNIDERADLEDWQARINNQFTRNKVLAILGKVVQVLPIAQFTPRGDEDSQKAQILTNLYEYAEDVDDYEELMVCALLEAIVKGTAIGYEGVERKEKIIKNVKKIDDKLTYVARKEIKTRLYGAIIPLEDFYPQHVGIRNIKSMGYCFWRSVLPYEKFMMDFGMYAKSAKVQPKTVTDNEGVSRPYYLDFISSDCALGSVEVIRYYNKDTDEYVMLANGVWLNPIYADSGEEISPIPFNHKELPFWDIRFDLFGSDFFYGKSLPDRLKSMQDVLNVLTNMLLDQSFLTIFPPILTTGFDDLEDDYLRPGRRIPVDTGGLPISQAFSKLDLGTPSGWHQYILEYTKRIMEESSLDQVSSGVAGVGGRTTAQEIRVAAEGVASMLGLFGRAVNYGLKKKAALKGSNALQFWTDPSSPMVQKVLGEGANEQFNKAFNTFKVDGAVLTSGKRGVKIIEMYANKEDHPHRGTLKARGMLAKLDTGKETEIIAIDPEYIRDYQADVKIVTNPKKEATRDLDKAMQLEKVRIYMSFFPNQVDINELAAQTAEKLGDDPTKIFKPEVTQPPQQKEGQNPEAASPMSTQPEGNIANNMTRGAQGGEVNSMQLRDLQNSMTG